MRLVISRGSNWLPTITAMETSTCVKKIRDDVMNAGAFYVDEPLVIDGNLITSRVPADLPQFNEALGRAIGLGN